MWRSARGYKELVEMKPFKVRTLLVSMLCLALTGCAARLPERPNIAQNAIPELDSNHARVFLYFGIFYMPNGLGGYHEFSNRGGMDGSIFVGDEYVSYVNEQAIVIDLVPGTYSVSYKITSLLEEYGKTRVSKPYQLTANRGDVLYLKANVKDDSSQAAAWLGALGAVGGAIYGANVRFLDYLEEDSANGPKVVSEAGIGDYCDITSRKTPNKTPSP